jgi:hypothetical protein
VRLVSQPRDLVRRHAAQDGLGAFGHGLDNDEVAEALQKVLDEAAGVMAGLDHAVHGAEDRGGIGCGHSLDDVIQQGRVGVAEQGDGQFVVKPVLPGTCHQLVQNGQ